MRAAEGAISRARARARAHLEIVDFREHGEIQSGQLCVPNHLTHTGPRASSAAGAARRDARGCGRGEPGTGGGKREQERTSRLRISSIDVDADSMRHRAVSAIVGLC